MSDVIGHFSILELLWTAIAVVAIFVSGFNLYEAHRDIKALGPIRNGRHRIAIGNARREAIRILVSTANLGLGVLAGLIPAPASVNPTSIIFSAVFIGTSALLAFNSFLDRADRRYLIHFRGPETPRQLEDRIAGIERRGGYQSAQERTADATERIADTAEHPPK